MTPEAKAYEKLKIWLSHSTKPVDLVRLENIISSGVPDVNACCDGIETWIELKSQYREMPYIRKAQHAWITRRRKHGGRVCIFVYNPLEMQVRIWWTHTAEPVGDDVHVMLTSKPTFDFIGSRMTVNDVNAKLWRMLFDHVHYQMETTG